MVAQAVQALTAVLAAATVVQVVPAVMAAPEPAECLVRPVGSTPIRRVMVHRVAPRTDGLTTQEPIRRSVTHRLERARLVLVATAQPLASTAR